MRDKPSLINASEVGDYVFCARAWRLRAEGHAPAASRPALEAGTEWHRAHGGEVERAGRLQAATLLLSALGALALLLLVLLVVSR